MTDLQGRVALITGGSSGIGAAIGTALGGRGVRVVLGARRLDAVERVAAAITSGGGEALAVECDVRDPEQVRALIAATTERFGGLDILVANAGLGYRAPIVDGDIERWKVMLDTNVYGVLLTLKYGVPPILARGGGDVFLLSSTAGEVVSEGSAAYSATKFAVNAIGEALRREVTRQHVRVTLLAPGAVVSGFQEVAGYAPDQIDRWMQGQPPMQPEDVAQAVLAALDLPAHMAINHMLMRPTGQVGP